MKHINTVFRDQFGTRYQVIASALESPHPAVERMTFFCPELTQRFMRDLCVPVNFWRKFLVLDDRGGYLRGLNDCETLSLVVNFLIHGRAKVYQGVPLS